MAKSCDPKKERYQRPFDLISFLKSFAPRSPSSSKAHSELHLATYLSLLSSLFFLLSFFLRRSAMTSLHQPTCTPLPPPHATPTTQRNRRVP